MIGKLDINEGISSPLNKYFRNLFLEEEFWGSTFFFNINALQKE